MVHVKTKVSELITIILIINIGLVMIYRYSQLLQPTAFSLFSTMKMNKGVAAVRHSVSIKNTAVIIFNLVLLKK
jgi:hypothetical protein